MLNQNSPDLGIPNRVNLKASRFRSDPSADRAKAGRTGAPRTVDRPVERREALRLALGARGALPREVGTLIPPQGCPLVPWRLPPLHLLARFARDWQTSDALRRENAEVWLFEI